MMMMNANCDQMSLDTILEEHNDENLQNNNIHHLMNSNSNGYESPKQIKNPRVIKSTGKLIRKKCTEQDDDSNDWTPKKLTFGEVYVCEFYKKRPPSDLPPVSPRGDRLYVRRRSERFSKSLSGHPSRNLEF
jgi:hypothetical protein